MAITRRTWINHPIIGKVINPTSHNIISTIPIVKSISIYFYFTILLDCLFIISQKIRQTKNRVDILCFLSVSASLDIKTDGASLRRS